MKRIDENICKRCDAHNSEVIDYRNGIIVCQCCGFVFFDRIIDDTYEGKNYNNENGGNRGENRIGTPMKAGEKNNLGSNLIYYDRNGVAKKARVGNGAYNQSPIERNFEEIDKILGNKDISKALIEETKDIYIQVTKELKMKRRNLKTMIYAMHFIASRKKGLSKSFTEISKVFGIEEKRIKKAYNYIKKIVVKSLSAEQLNETIKNYIDSFCEKNREDYQYKQLSSDIAEKINDSCLLEGRNTKTITGISLLIAFKLVKTQNVNKKMICDNFAKENTMNIVFEKIKDFLVRIIPEKYHNQIPNLSIK